MAAIQWHSAIVAALALLLCGDSAGVLLAQSSPKLLTPPARRTAAPPTPADVISEPVAPPTSRASASPPAKPAESRDLTPAVTVDARAGLRITKGSGVLPNEHGQVWREYDISPYTLKVKDTDRPQQAIIDWILRETGTDAWFSEPLGILSAGTTTLRVYHTPEMQQLVRGIVERFIASEAAAQSLNVRLVTVGSPNWRAKAVPLLKPIDVQSAGVEAWLLSRENAAMLYEELRARADFHEHSSPQLEIFNGQSQTLARKNPQRYSRGVQPRSDGLAYEVVPGQIDEGYSLQISPLMSLDGKSADVAIKCQVDQVEKLVPILVDVPVPGQGQRVQIQVPQMVSWRLSERFRWPTGEVLLLSCGVVANPGAEAAGPLSMLSPFAPRSRADALLFVSVQGPPTAVGSVPTAPITPIPPAVSATRPPTSMSRGRY